MRIGILTVHSQINYGAVLQAYALQSILSDMGHDVIVLDRQLDKDCSGPLLGALANGNLECWIKLIGRGLLMLGDFSDLIRRIKTASFIKQNLHLSLFKFKDLDDLPSTFFDVDMILLGSDQIWNTKCHNPRVYLLDAEINIPIAVYAASFGMEGVDPEWSSLFKRRLHSLLKISAREYQGISILNGFDITAQKVLDPTLLPPSSVWQKFIRKCRDSKPRLVCYLTTMPSVNEMQSIYAFAKRQKCEVEMYVGVVPVELPKSIGAYIGLLRDRVVSSLNCVKRRLCATPAEFINSIHNAKWVITSAYHGLMFACIFRKQVRLVRDYHRNNPAGFRRMEEFVDDFIMGQVIVGSIRDALVSLDSETIGYDEPKLAANVVFSINWLSSVTHLNVGSSGT